MPIEILEKIIALTIPTDISVKAIYIAVAKQRNPFEWSPSWLPGLFLVSKRIRGVALGIIRARAHFGFQVGGREHFGARVYHELGRKAWTRFKESFGWGIVDQVND
jgi:hypothetical protein